MIQTSASSLYTAGIDCVIYSNDAKLCTQRLDNTASPVDHRLQRFSNMSLTAQDIDRIANLARLELQSEEKSAALNKINDFFAIVEQIKAIDTSGITPMAHPVDAMRDAHISLRLREDKATEPNQRQANQQSAPAVDRGLFLVPKVIE
jgi:aspartyl-tRNA(Asn)/glutamyl-tRNA(Gln) amidotransferase subunit C